MLQVPVSHKLCPRQRVFPREFRTKIGLTVFSCFMQRADFSGAPWSFLWFAHKIYIVHNLWARRPARGFRWDFAGRRSPAAASRHLPPRGSVIRFLILTPLRSGVFLQSVQAGFSVCAYFYSRGLLNQYLQSKPTIQSAPCATKKSRNRKKGIDKSGLYLYNNLCRKKVAYAAMAQVVEHILGKDEVSSSNLLSSSTKTPQKAWL